MITEAFLSNFRKKLFSNKNKQKEVKPSRPRYDSVHCQNLFKEFKARVVKILKAQGNKYELENIEEALADIINLDNCYPGYAENMYDTYLNDPEMAKEEGKTLIQYIKSCLLDDIYGDGLSLLNYYDPYNLKKEVRALNNNSSRSDVINILKKYIKYNEELYQGMKDHKS